jgi:hypothetical protein
MRPSMRQSMRQPFIILALLASTMIGTSAAADMSEFGESLSEYFSATGSHFLTGLNSVITAPADPVMNVVTPPEEYQKLPAGEYTGRFVGMLQGTFMLAYRMGMGTLDMVLSPIPIVILSPEPRYQPIPGFEWDE